MSEDEKLEQGCLRIIIVGTILLILVPVYFIAHLIWSDAIGKQPWILQMIEWLPLVIVGGYFFYVLNVQQVEANINMWRKTIYTIDGFHPPVAQLHETAGGIFISYARSDSDFIDLFAHDIEAQGYAVWIDQREIEGGQEWQREIRQAIDSCRVIAVVCSPDAMRSTWVRSEYEYAKRQNKIIIPLLYLPTDLPAILMTYQMINFRAGVAFAAHYQEGFTAFLVALNHHGLQPAHPGTNAELKPDTVGE